MQIPKTGNMIVDKAIGAKGISRSGNQVVVLPVLCTPSAF